MKQGGAASHNAQAPDWNNETRRERHRSNHDRDHILSTA
jgi:hypothetical protein